MHLLERKQDFTRLPQQRYLQNKPFCNHLGTAGISVFSILTITPLFLKEIGIVFIVK